MKTQDIRSAVVAIGPCDWEPKLVTAVAHPVSAVQVLRRCVYLVDALAAIQACAPDMVIISPHLVDLDQNSSLLLHDHLRACAQNGRSTRLVGVSTNEEEQADLHKLGFASVINFDPEALPRFLSALQDQTERAKPTISKALIQRPASRQTQKRKQNKTLTGRAEARLVAVLGTSGSPGRSWVAVSLADEFARSGEKTLLVDGDWAAPALAMMLGQNNETASLGAACRLAERDSLTEQTLRQAACQISHNFWLLGGTDLTRQSSNLRLAAIEKVLDCALTSFESVIVDATSFDLGEAKQAGLSVEPTSESSIYGLNKYLVGVAHRIVVCAIPTPVGLTRLVMTLSELADHKLGAPVWVALNKCPKRKLSALVREASDLLKTHAGDQPVVGIALDRRGFAKAELAARTLASVAPRSPARRGITLLRDSLEKVVK